MTLLNMLWCLVFHRDLIVRGQMGRWHYWECTNCGTCRIWKM